MRTGEKDKGSVSIQPPFIEFLDVLGSLRGIGDTENKTGKGSALRKPVFQLGETDNKHFYEGRRSCVVWRKRRQDKGAEECWEGGNWLLRRVVRESCFEKVVVEQRPEEMREELCGQLGESLFPAEGTASTEAQRLT